MSHEIKIPSVGESISSATIGTWHKEDGDYVDSGEIILTIETDKISTELESDKAGILKRLAEEGDELDIGTPVAEIEEGERPSDDGGDESKSEEKSEDDSEEKSEEDQADSSDTGKSSEEEKQSPDDEKTRDDSDKEVKATPVARKVAEDQGVKLATVTGTGSGGKITKSDVLDAAESRGPSRGEAGERTSPSLEQSRAPRGSTKPTEDSERTTRRKMSPLRKKIASHLVNAQRDAAILTTFNECDMTNVMALRKRIQDDFVSRHDVKLGFMSFFIKAVVDALKAVPSVNAQIDGDEIIENHFHDIGVAVGTEKGLIVPVVRDCADKSFAEIEQDILDYAKKAREGSIGLEDLQGGVFTITNGGIYGSLLSTPILNPPQSAILGMHSIQERPVAVDGEVVIRPMMYLALSYDHRIVDGKEAVTFLVRVKECIENPERMLVGA